MIFRSHKSHRARVFRYLQFIRRFAELQLIVSYGGRDYDGDHWQNNDTQDIHKIARTLWQDQWQDKNVFSKCRTTEQVQSAMWSTHDDIQGVTPPELFAAQRKKTKRRELEGAAAALLARFDMQEMDSIEFIQACFKEQERLRDYREGMREDGLCIGYGVTYEQWSDEHSASFGDSDRVEEILDFMRSSFPLLWAQWKELGRQAQINGTNPVYAAV